MVPVLQHRTSYFYHDIMPRGQRVVARPKIIRQTGAADKGRFPIDQQQFSMIAKQSVMPVFQSQRIAKVQLKAGLEKCLTVFFIQPLTTIIIEQEVYFHPAVRGFSQGPDEFSGNSAGGNQVLFQKNIFFRRGDGVKHFTKKLGAVNKQFKTVAMTARV